MSYLEERRNKLISQIKPGSIAISFSGSLVKSTADQSYPFEVNRNFYYLTDIDKPDFAIVLIKTLTGEISTILFAKVASELEAKWNSNYISKEQAATLSQLKIDKVKDILELDEFVHKVFQFQRFYEYGLIKNIYLDFERETSLSLKSSAIQFKDKVSSLYPDIKIKNLFFIFAELRQIKDSHEIDEIRKAIAINKLALEAVAKKIKGFTNESDIETEFNYVLNKNKTTTSFNTIVANEINATTLHYTSNQSDLVKDSLILMDCGVKYKWYASDITRTFPYGTVTPRQAQIYNIVLACNKEAIKFLKPGVLFKEYIDFAKNFLGNELVKIGLISDKSEVTKYYFHGLGHFVGLDVHDFGNYLKPFEKGMVITCEPGLYIPEEKIGVRIEDDVLITETGSENLSIAIPKELDDLIKLTKQN